MTKEYFSHDYGTRHKKRLAALVSEKKMRGYGLFWVIVEMLHEDSTRWMELDEMTYIAIAGQSGENVTYIKEFVDACINRYKVFMQHENKFTTERVLRNIDKRLEISASRSESGRRGAEAKWQTDGKPMANAKQTDSNEMAKNGKGKEIKVKEKKVNKNKKGGWDQFPTAETTIEIEDAEVTQAITFVMSVKRQTLTPQVVREFFTGFRANLSGEFSASRGRFMQHFRNWLKDRDFSVIDNSAKPVQTHFSQEDNRW